MKIKPVLMAAGAGALAAALIAGSLVLAAGTNSPDASSASNAMSQSAQSGGSSSASAEKTTPAQCWDDYGAAEIALANTLAKSSWKQASQTGNGPTMALDGTQATIVTASGSSSQRTFGLKDAKSESITGDGDTITRTTATAVSSDGKEHALTLDVGGSGSVLTCDLFGGGAWTAAGEAGECAIGAVPAGMDSLIGGNGEKMREAVASYVKENVPLAVSATCISTCTVDTEKGKAHVTWAVSAPSNRTLSADVDLSTGDVSVSELES